VVTDRLGFGLEGRGDAEDAKAQRTVGAIGIAIGIGIEIASTIAIDRMPLAERLASAAEATEQGKDSSIPIPIPIAMPISMGAPPLTSPSLCASASLCEVSSRR